ncbi:MAG: DNA topoisomerase 4 subunit A [Clostridiales bacterium]|nr:DNA topoisomerase 4 subunit A [Clostridiales bacterium]
MAKKPPEVITPDIIQTPLEDVLHQSMMPYAEYVILERAIPRVEDGLKPVQRRILYTMNELGLTPDKPHRKCARIVGDCLGKYHPHGDSSVYDALTRMAQPYSLRGVMVDGHGNFGSIDGDSAAAMRYTEARMAPLALQMLRDIEKDTVPFRLNFDDTLKEPDLLPARFPNLLVNGASGIAVGLATNIPTHNLREVTDAVCKQIDNPNVTLDELMECVPAPDFPTGGVLLDTPEIRAAYETGRGKLTVRAKVNMEQGSAGRTLLVITEIPYGVAKAAMLEKILKLSEEKKAALGCIHDIRDESDRTGMRAVIELKKEANPQKVLAYLYKYSDLQVTFGVNMVAVAAGKPVQMGLKTVISHFIRHQKEVVTRRTQYELEQAKARAHILEGLIIAVDNLDEVIALIRASKNGKEAKARLMERFGFTDIQAQAILDLRLQRLTGLEIEALRKEYADILKLISTLEGILKSEKKLMNVIKKELLEIADQFGDDRRTVILKEKEEEALPLTEEAPVPEEAVVFLTRGGQLRRMAPRYYEKMDMPMQENEMPRWLFHTQTDHTLFFFTDKGNCYPLSVGALNESNKPKERGGALSGVLAGLETGEKCVSLLLITPGSLNAMGDLIFFTAQGQVKRTNAAEYDVKRAKFAAINLKNGDSLLSVVPAEEGADFLMLSHLGQCIRFKADTVPEMGRVSAGVRGMKLDEKDEIILATPITNSDQVLLFTERGYAKRLMGAMFDTQGRAGKGVKCVSFNKSGSTGTYVAAAARITASRAFTVYQNGGMMTSMTSDELPCQDLADKGKPTVLAVLDDVVLDLIL